MVAMMDLEKVERLEKRKVEKMVDCLVENLVV